MSSGFHHQNEHVQSQNPNPNGDVPVPVTSLGTSSFPHSSSTTIDKRLPLALLRRIQVYPRPPPIFPTCWNLKVSFLSS